MTLALTIVRAMRPHHWVKNLLIFVPILSAHRWAEPVLWGEAAFAALAFSLCSSAVYLTNDFLDIEDDRSHPEKRKRPLASGTLRTSHAHLLAVVLASVGLAMGLYAGIGWVLGIYILVSLAYSIRLTTMRWVDIITLVGLYMLRLLAGGMVTGIPVSGWLLGYGALVFGSLALAKRSAELVGVAAGELPAPQRRGYRTRDIASFKVLGLVATTGSFALLMAYLHDAQSIHLYSRPQLLLLSGAAVFLWLVRVWLLASQGRMRTDPVVFALRDPISLGAGFFALLVLVLAAG